MTTIAPPPSINTAPAARVVPAPAKPEPDRRYLALRNFALSISVFNIFGYTLLGFEQPWLWPIFAVLTAYAAEISFELIRAWAKKETPGSSAAAAAGCTSSCCPRTSPRWPATCSSTPTTCSCRSRSP